MVSRLTLKKPEYEKYWARAKEVLTESESLQNTLLALVDEDSSAFTELLQAYRLPKEKEEEKRKRSEEIQERLKAAANVPMKTAQNAAKTLTIARTLAEFGNENALSDLQTAIHLAHAGALGAVSNVTINLAAIKDEEYNKQMRTRLESLHKEVETDKSAALAVLAKRSAKN